jgi:hypothetical protein
MRLRGVIVLLCLPAGLAGCGDDDVSRDALVRAADKTRDAGGARIAGHGVFAPAIDRAWRFSRTGVRDARGSTDVTTRHAVIEGPAQPPWVVHSIKVGDTNYFRYPGGGPLGKGWLSIERTSAEETLLAGPDPADPGAITRALDLADVKRIGDERVRGVPTAHYEATIDLRDFARLASPEAVSAVRDAYQRAVQQGGGGSLRVDLWIDDNDLIRRVRQRLRTRLTGIDYPPDDQTTELFDFGLDDQVVPPPKSETRPLAP